MRILAFILQPVAIRKILTHLERQAMLAPRARPRRAPAGLMPPPELPGLQRSMLHGQGPGTHACGDP